MSERPSGVGAPSTCRPWAGKLVTRALLFGLFSMVLSYFMGLSREAAISPMVFTMVVSLLLPLIIRRADPPR